MTTEKHEHVFARIGPVTISRDGHLNEILFRCECGQETFLSAEDDHYLRHRFDA